MRAVIPDGAPRPTLESWDGGDDGDDGVSGSAQVSCVAVCGSKCSGAEVGTKCTGKARTIDVARGTEEIFVTGVTSLIITYYVTMGIFVVYDIEKWAPG